MSFCCAWAPPSPDRNSGALPDHTRDALDHCLTRGRGGRGCVVLLFRRQRRLRSRVEWLRELPRGHRRRGVQRPRQAPGLQRVGRRALVRCAKQRSWRSGTVDENDVHDDRAHRIARGRRRVLHQHASASRRPRAPSVAGICALISQPIPVSPPPRCGRYSASRATRWTSKAAPTTSEGTARCTATAARIPPGRCSSPSRGVSSGSACRVNPGMLRTRPSNLQDHGRTP